VTGGYAMRVSRPPGAARRARATVVVVRRDPEVETQIVDALGVAQDRLVQRAAVRDRQPPAYLQEETLVHLIRAYRKRGCADIVNDLSECLAWRVAAYIHRRIVELPPDVADEGFDEVTLKLFAEILDPDNADGDLLEVRFWPVLHLIILPVRRTLLRRLKREKGNVPFDADSLDLAGPGATPDSRREGTALPPLSGERYVLVREAIESIRMPYREAFYLRYGIGLPIGDKHSRKAQHQPATRALATDHLRVAGRGARRPGGVARGGDVRGDAGASNDRDDAKRNEILRAYIASADGPDADRLEKWTKRAPAYARDLAEINAACRRVDWRDEGTRGWTRRRWSGA